MAPGIVKLADDEYVDWSTVCDAPRSTIMTRTAAVAAFGADRVERTDRNGHSWLDRPAMPPDRVIAGNRAGPNERELNLEQLRTTLRREAP
jgi:hypothetical protein